MEPEELTYQLLREITDDFLEKLKVGEGAFGTVYKVTFGHVFVVKSLAKTLQPFETTYLSGSPRC